CSTPRRPVRRTGPWTPGSSRPEATMDWLFSTDFDLAREILQRGVAVIYLVAFVAAWRQFLALLGERGLLPVPRFVARAGARAGSGRDLRTVRCGRYALWVGSPLLR